MSLVSPDDFRVTSLANYCVGISLTDNEADDTVLGEAIAEASQYVDEYCSDIFGGVTETLTLDGSGEARLWLPRRCTAISALVTLDQFGNPTTQASEAYRLHSSLVDAGSKRLARDARDWVELVYLGTGISTQLWFNPWKFYPESQSIRITGDWGWTTPPLAIKTAIALLAYDQVKASGSVTVRHQRMQAGAELYDNSVSSPTGIPKVDTILAEYDYERTPRVAIA